MSMTNFFRKPALPSFQKPNQTISPQITKPKSQIAPITPKFTDTIVGLKKLNSIIFKIKKLNSISK